LEGLEQVNICWQSLVQPDSMNLDNQEKPEIPLPNRSGHWAQESSCSRLLGSLWMEKLKIWLHLMYWLTMCQHRMLTLLHVSGVLRTEYFGVLGLAWLM